MIPHCFVSGIGRGIFYYDILTIMIRIVLKKYALMLAWAQALVAMLGSLYFSEVLGFPPCVLCWYQRIALYPLVILIGVGIIRKDRNVIFYALPLAGIGWIISIYHNLLYYKIVPDTLAPCSLGVSCTTKFIEWYGFITIPFLALIGLTAIIALLFIDRKLNQPSQH